MTLTLSLADSGFAPSLSVGVPRVSVKLPERLPALPTSTVPTRAGSPGRMSVADVKMAVPSLVFEIDSVPVANVVFGLADVAVKSAPEAAVIPTATSTVASAASVRLGRSTRACRRDMRGETLLGTGLRATPRTVSAQSLSRAHGRPAAGNRAISPSDSRDPWLCVPASRRVCLGQHP